jgi:hypothetical protein
MESVPFKFNHKQRQTLAATLRRFPDDLVQSFLNRCEYAITEWRAAGLQNRRIESNGNRSSLRILGKAIRKVRGEINGLSDEASCALWVSWQYEKCGDITKLWAAKNAYLLHLLELEQLASTVADELPRAAAGGVEKSCEIDLVNRLVEAYLDSSFGRKPSAAPTGIFMSFLGELENMLTLPGGNNLVLGKHIVATSIKHLSQRRARLLLQQAGMYEFSINQDS